MNTDLPPHLQAMQNIQANRDAVYRQRDTDKRRAAKEAANKVVVEQQEKDVKGDKWRCCLNCLEWTTEGCGKFKAMPPPHIILHGCVEHDYDIPF